MTECVAVARKPRPAAADHSRVSLAPTYRRWIPRSGALGGAALTVALGFAVATAPLAGADEAGYLQRLQSTLAYLTPQQLLTEGYKVCQQNRRGHPSSDAIPMVTTDLAISVPAAVDIIVAAGGELGC